MKRFLVVLSLLAVLSTAGCAAWFAELKSNPITALEDGVSYIRNAESLAKGAFDLWASAEPELATASVRSQFEMIVARVDQALVVAQDALHVAADVHGAPPNVAALLTDAQTAVGDLWSFLSGLAGNTVGHAASPQMQSALSALHNAATRHY